MSSLPVNAAAIAPPSLPAPIKLIVLDYDFTVHDWETAPSVDEAFFEHMTLFQGMGGLFAINSGRTLEQMTQGLLELDEGLRPDFLLTTEREVWRPAPGNAGDWEAYGDWNTRCNIAHDELAAEGAHLLALLAEELTYRYRGMRLVWKDRVLQGLVAQHAKQMADICAMLEERLATGEHSRVPLHYQRNDVYLRFCHREYHKGAALGELSRLLGLDADKIFVAGDNHNDLSMLQRGLASYLACPGNSIEEVKAAVRAQGGYVASGRCSLGVTEALAHFRVLGWNRIAASTTASKGNSAAA